MNLGGLTFELMADIARLRQDMADANRVVSTATDGIAKAAGIANKALGLLGVGLSVGAVVAWGKAAIDAGDDMKAFGQKTGVAVKDVAGLQLAFKQGGVEGEALQGAIGKLAKRMAEGGAGFDDLGIKTRNADGTMRNVKDVLYDVADATADMKDGLAKSATVQDIFGKSGAALIPTLNEGSEGLREMADMADKLGLSMSQETAEGADKFNDTVELLGMSLSGIARKTMAELLPTLNSLAGTFLTNITEGDTLTRVAEGIATAFKGVYIGVALGVEAFSTFGKLIGGVVAQSVAQIGGLAEAVVKVLSGDFKGALDSAQSAFRMSRQIAVDTATDIGAGWSKTAKTIEAVWDGTGGKVAEEMVKVNRQIKEGKVLTKEQADAIKARNAEIQKAVQAGRDLMAATEAKNSAAQFELDMGRKLTQAETENLKLTKDLASGKVVLTAAEERLQRAAIATGAAIAAETKWMEESRKVNEQVLDLMTQRVEAAQDETIKQLEANEAIGKTTAQLAAMKIERLDELALMADRRALLADDIDLTGQMGDNQRKLAQALRDTASAARGGEVLRVAQETADEWKKTVDSVSSGLTDALFRGFESGKGFFVNFRDTLTNAFKTLVLQPRIKAIFESVVGGGAGLLGAGGAQAADGSSLGGLSNLTSLFGGNSLGVGLGQGLVGVGNSLVGMGFDGIGSSISGFANGAAGVSNLAYGAAGLLGGIGGSLFGGKGSMGGSLGATLGMALSGGNPLVAGLGSLAGGVIGSLFGKSTPYNAGGNYLAKADGTGARISDKSLFDLLPGLGKPGFQDFTKRGSSGFDDATKALADGLQGSLAKMLKTFDQDAQDVFVAFRQNGKKGLGQINIGGELSNFRTGENDPQKAFEQFVAYAPKALLDALNRADIPEWAKGLLSDVGDAPGLKELDAFVQTVERAKSLGAELGSGFDDAISKLAKTGESISETINRLYAIDEVSKALNQFGGVFSEIAGSSIEARESLITLAGGIDALVSKANAFVSDYYTKDEQTGLQARAVSEALKAAGVDGSALGSREDFRRLVESIGTSTEEQRKQLVALLDIGPAFAKIADSLKDQGRTLGGAAADAPLTAMLDAIVSPAQNTTQAVTNVGDQIKAGNTILGAINASVQASNAALASGLGAIANATGQAVAAARAAAETAAASARALANIEANAGLQTSAPSYGTDVGGRSR